jgi:aspartate/methionine/tyrosine aminotransferase
MAVDRQRYHPVYAGMATTIFEKMSGLSRELGAINLGQGFPDDQGPPELIAAAARALAERSNQYPPMVGVPELRDAIAAFYARRQGLSLSREQVIVTSGATEAVAAALLALVQPGDDVIVFEPAYDAYAPMIRRCGATPVFVRLSPPDWRYEQEAIERAITPRTRVLILNDPLNPTGSVASDAELAMLADICVTHDLVAICDEVWEQVRFDGQPHRSLLTFPGMADRAVKIGSAGKIFGVTGWKIGWMCAAPEMAAMVARAHQFLTFTTPPALQYAVAEGLANDTLIDSRTAGWAASRQQLNDGLVQAGFAVLPGVATWFTCVDLAASGLALDDLTFAGRAIHEAGVASIPVSALFDDGSPSSIVRLCHCKSPEMIDDAVARLAAFRVANGT